MVYAIGKLRRWKVGKGKKRETDGRQGRERGRSCGGGICAARDAADTFNALSLKFPGGRRRAELLRCQRKLRYLQVTRIEAEIHTLQAHETLNQQRRRNHQRQRERDFS